MASVEIETVCEMNSWAYVTTQILKMINI